jgi:site-specific DNA-methyltransferase (adenine-specific)
MNDQTLSFFAEDATCEKMGEPKSSLTLPKETSQRPWPPAGVKWYYYDDHTAIAHADCRDILPHLPKVDLVLTDPPYGVTQNQWDDLSITLDAFDCLSCVPIVCTCQNPSSSILVSRYLKRFKWSDVWEKSQAKGFLNCKIMPLRQHEDILVFCDGKIPFYPQITKKNPDNIRPHLDTGQSSNYGQFSESRTRTIPLDKTYPRSIVKLNNSQNRYHPTEKPLQLFLYLLKSFSASGDTILDPFMGSGTTLVAAQQLGRHGIGIEIEEKYCEIAVKRLQQEVLPL